MSRNCTTHHIEKNTETKVSNNRVQVPPSALANLLHEVGPAVIGVLQIVDVLLPDAQTIVLDHEQRSAHSSLGMVLKKKAAQQPLTKHNKSNPGILEVMKWSSFETSYLPDTIRV